MGLPEYYIRKSQKVYELDLMFYISTKNVQYFLLAYYPYTGQVFFYH